MARPRLFTLATRVAIVDRRLTIRLRYRLVKDRMGRRHGIAVTYWSNENGRLLLVVGISRRLLAGSIGTVKVN